MTEQHILRLVRDTLSEVYPPGEAKAIGRLLLEVGFGVTQTDIYLDKVRYFSPEEELRLREMLRRLRQHEPIQYVLGEADFDGLTLLVKPGVLIPRPETAELVRWAASEVSPYAHILDVGTGSGCIALALAHRLPHSDVTAWDLSTDAIRIAQANAWRLKKDVAFCQCDLMVAAFEGSDEPRPTYDLIISNPPYVCQSERKEMERNVLDYEPDSALFVPDSDPLCYYRALVRLSVRRMRSGGLLMVEINRRYGAAVAELFVSAGLRAVELRKDTFGNDRMVKGVCP